MRSKTIKARARFTSKPPNTIYWGKVCSPYGKIVIGFTPQGEVCFLSFLGKKEDSPTAKFAKRWPSVKFVEKQKEAAKIAQKIFYGGKTKIHAVGTPFQIKVWKELLKVKNGETVSYAELARRIGKPKAARAVGHALGANPLPVLIPCHRVIASNGNLGGFSAGIAFKQKLLSAEKSL